MVVFKNKSFTLSVVAPPNLAETFWLFILFAGRPETGPIIGGNPEIKLGTIVVLLVVEL